jgi:hypothetical protein
VHCPPGGERKDLVNLGEPRHNSRNRCERGGRKTW